MKIEEIAKDLIYPSLEMQVLEQTKPTVENRPKETFGAKRRHILIAPKEFEFDHDVWTTEHLGYEKGIHAHHKINFSYIQQPWLKYYFKKFILYLSNTRLAFSTLIVKVAYINVFQIS